MEHASFDSEEQLKLAIEKATELPLIDLPKLIEQCYQFGRGWCGENHYYFVHGESLYVIGDEDYIPIVKECRPVDSMTQEEFEELERGFSFPPWEMPYSTVDDEQLIYQFDGYRDFDPGEFRRYLEACQDEGEWIATKAMIGEA